jgi:hypothetical protein
LSTLFALFCEQFLSSRVAFFSDGEAFVASRQRTASEGSAARIAQAKGLSTIRRGFYPPSRDAARPVGGTLAQVAEGS